MTADEFRSLALELPEATEEEHMNHPDFRVGGNLCYPWARRGGGWSS